MRKNSLYYIVINISDGYFGRRCGPRGADIVLSATADTIVHGFEIYRTSTSSPPPTSTSTSTSSPPSPPTPTEANVGTIVVAVVVPIGLCFLFVVGYYYYRLRCGDHAKVDPAYTPKRRLTPAKSARAAWAAA